MAMIPDFYLNAVASIGIRISPVDVKWIGTGFFVVRKVDNNGNSRPFLVTNKHVVENTKTIVLRFNSRDGSGIVYVDAPLEENENTICCFHRNELIDIAVIPLNGGFITENNLLFSAFDIDEHAMSSNELLENGVDEGSLIYMLGFPMGLINEQSTLPICRLGCIARLGKTQITETNNYLIDLQNFPGNSGSPIITRPEVLSIEGTSNLTRTVLAGIVHSYIPYREELVNKQTGEVVELRSENSGLALAHPIEYVREIIDGVQTKI